MFRKEENFSSDRLKFERGQLTCPCHDAIAVMLAVYILYSHLTHLTRGAIIVF